MTVDKIFSDMIMSFDFGTKSIGVAIGQRVTCTANPLMTLKAYKGVPNWLQIDKIFMEWQPNTIVVGLPLNMNCCEQLITTLARKFAHILHCRFGSFGTKVFLHDERLSTVEARSILFKHGGYSAMKKCKVDALSAVIILESWLEHFTI